MSPASHAAVPSAAAAACSKVRAPVWKCAETSTPGWPKPVPRVAVQLFFKATYPTNPKATYPSNPKTAYPGNPKNASAPYKLSTNWLDVGSKPRTPLSPTPRTPLSPTPRTPLRATAGPGTKIKRGQNSCAPSSFFLWLATLSGRRPLGLHQRQATFQATRTPIPPIRVKK